MPLLPFGAPPTASATVTAKGKVTLGAYCFNQVPAGVALQVPAGMTLLQAGDFDLSVGDLDLSLGDACWVD